MSSFSYKVGVKLAMTSNMPEMLTAIASKLTGVNLKVDQLTGKFTRLQKAVAGVGMVWAGDKIISSMAKMARYGDKIVEQQAQLRTLGLSAQNVSAATAYATRIASQLPTTTIAGNLKHLGELRYGSGSMAIAQAILPMVSQANAILRSKLGNVDTDQIWPMVKSLEMKGVLNPQTLPRFRKYLDEMVQAVVATNGIITPRDFLKTFVYGRTAMLGWDSTFMPYLTRAMQSLGTSGAGGGGRSGPGNALMSAFAAVVQGQMPKKAAQMFAALGLGSMQGITGSGQALTSINGVKLFERNPYEWVQTVLMPALAAHHITMPNGMNPDNLKKLFGSNAALAEARQRDDIIGVISQLFRNRTASQIISEFALFGSYAQGNASMYEKDKTMQKDAMGLNAYGALIKMSPGMRQMILGAQYENMMEALGKALVPIQMNVLTALTKLFNTIANLSMNHPAMMTGIAAGMTALGIFLVSAGGIALLSAIGVGGWLVVGLGALAGVIGLFAALDWNGMVAGIKTFIAQMKALAQVIDHPLSLRAWEGRDIDTGKPINPHAPPTVSWGQWWHNLMHNPGAAFGLGASDQTKKTIKDATHDGTKKGVTDALRAYHPTAYFGGASAPAFIRTGYSGGAFFNNGVYYAGSSVGGAPSTSAQMMPGALGLGPMGGLGGVTRIPGIPGGVFIGHGRGAGVPASGAVTMPDIPGNVTGNAYVKAARAGFAKELADPQKRLAFAAMMLSEGGSKSLPVAESAMNRSLYAHKTLMHALFDGANAGKGFYGPINRGQLPAFEARLRRNPKLMAQMDALINKALAGSDTIHGFTDQGMVSDPNGHWGLLHQHMMYGGNIFTDWGGGPGGHSGAEAWRQNFESHANALPSPAIAARGGGQHVTVHSTIKLDGRTVANSTARHLARMGNIPSRSGSMPDPFAHTPSLPV